MDVPRKPAACFARRVQARGPKIFFFPKYSIYDLTKSSRAHYGGRFAIVTTRGAGCDGRGRAARRAAGSRTVKPCGPGTSTLVSSLRAIRKRRWLTSPIHRGEYGAAVKPLRRECRMFRRTCGDYACGPSTLFCPRGCGCGQRPAFPAPSVLQGVQSAKLGHSMPRERSLMSASLSSSGLTGRPSIPEAAMLEPRRLWNTDRRLRGR